MKSTICKTFTASITIGLTRMYSEKNITELEFKKALLNAQKAIKTQYKIELSAKVCPCTILFLGQDEPSMEINFIQYPKFPQEESVLKNTIVELTKMMMLDLEQNRVVIVFTDETIMLEQSEAIAPNIKL